MSLPDSDFDFYEAAADIAVSMTSYEYSHNGIDNPTAVRIDKGDILYKQRTNYYKGFFYLITKSGVCTVFLSECRRQVLIPLPEEKKNLICILYGKK